MDFLDLLYGDLTREHALVVWTLPDKRSRWFVAPPECSQALSYGAERAGEGADVYWGLGLQPRALSAGSRGKADTVSAIPGLWIDVDYVHGVHAKPNLPPTAADARTLCEEMPYPPSVLIHSGHGYYGLWLFHEPWEFDSDAERAEAAWMVRQWQQTCRARARVEGWDVDATHDLTRVLRLPGTRNLKDPDEPMDVEIVAQSDARYSRDDLELMLVSDDPTLRSDVVPADLPEKWKPTGTVAGKFAGLLATDEKFAASWAHQRPDFQDQSLSTYDLSLASLAVNAGWADIEIADMLSAHREQWGDSRKGKRRDYIARTIGVARRRLDVVERAEAATQGDATALTAGDRQDVARHRWAQLGVPGVVAWYVLVGERNEFVLVTLHGELRFTAQEFATVTAAQKLVASHLGVTLVSMKQPAWLADVASLYMMAEQRGDALIAATEMQTWIEEWRGEYGTFELSTDEGETIDALRGGPVLSEDGKEILFRPSKLLAYLHVVTGDDQMRVGDLKARVLMAGGDIKRFVEVGDRRIRCWALPLE